MSFNLAGIKYIFLDEIPKKEIAQLANACYMSYTENSEKVPRCIQWSSIEEKNKVAEALINAANKELWCIAVDNVFRRYDSQSLQLDDYEVSIAGIKELGLTRLAKVLVPNSMKQPDGLIFRDLIHEAKKLNEQKTAFVFPASWSKSAAPEAYKLIENLSKELKEKFHFIDHSEDLGLVFLSLATDAKNTSPLTSFIGSLHSEMLKDATANENAWEKKHGTILLSGPTGSGKSYAVRSRKLPLVEINLSSVSESLLEARMRGYVKGAFTDANKEGRSGWFEDADGGVLFLDEFQSAPITFQAQLLDLLSAVSNDIQVARIGDDNNRKRFNVRVVLAINEDISSLLEQNRLRKDILYRVRHIESFPSLSERLKIDIENKYLKSILYSYRWKSLEPVSLDEIREEKIEKLLTYFPSFEKDALLELQKQAWEGNFRELERVSFDIFFEAEKTPGSEITAEQVRLVIQNWQSKITGSPLNTNKTELKESELQKLNAIQHALRKSGFVINTVISGGDQAYYKARQALRKYLKENKDFLDKDILSDSRMVKFMKLD
ncbi:sigma 54-interacting transcriptional regulator [Rheinheimera sp. 4Y26]|uniref:sigma 54-interacting transcriptional regulator n=1 Tax=Rheinheimera sp. 4Y26 TaxID=2977811 RepID=UPI0021B08FC4|nr:sigma 54-interacting transcriptional regulator [Rheinheimera sp. 4Y26]MCT6701464.1 sigma 54-interacting transcriptional regulator [Rheinheimera sp. 4Y26]